MAPKPRSQPVQPLEPPRATLPLGSGRPIRPAASYAQENEQAP